MGIHLEFEWSSVFTGFWLPPDRSKTVGLELHIARIFSEINQRLLAPLMRCVFVSWSNGEKEFYDLASDPYQLENVFQRLEPERQRELEASIRNFRVRDIAPKVVLNSPAFGDDVSHGIQFSGYAEDNSAPLLAKLTIRSWFTGRFYDGEQWHDSPAFIRIPVDAPGSPISSWSDEVKIYTQTPNDIDYLICYVQGIDDSARYGPWVSSLNLIEGHSMFARFNPALQNRKFEAGKDVRLNGYMGELEGVKVKVSVFRKTDAAYFDGDGFRSGYHSIPCELLENHRYMPESPFYQRVTDEMDFQVK